MFIDTIRKYQEQRVDNVYEKAIHECIEKGILADYLRVHGSEVVNMLMSEYNYEQDIEVQREEAFEEGEKRGQKRFAALAAKLIEAGRSEDIIKAAQNFVRRFMKNIISNNCLFPCVKRLDSFIYMC